MPQQVEEILADLVVDLVPQWYRADWGRNSNILEVCETQFTFFSHRTLTPGLSALKQAIEQRLPEWIIWLGEDRPAGAHELIQESFALEWLQICDPQMDWRRLLSYAMQMSQRTYENANICRNIVVTSGSGTEDITRKELQKLLDPLGTSPYSFIKVDNRLRFLAYEEIVWSSISDSEEYKFHPEFLHPFHTVMNEGDISVHLTSRGDLIIMNKQGLLAAKRQGRWKAYDVRTLKTAYRILSVNIG